MDRNHYFANPVSPDQAPDYHNIIERPMYWDKIKQKLDQREYLNLQDFKVSDSLANMDFLTCFHIQDDVYLVLDNSMRYNTKPDHLYHRVAARIKTNAGPILDGLQGYNVQLSGLPSSVGDLEPASDVMSLLVSTPAIENHSDMIIDAGDPIAALFSQLPLKVRTPPPAPPKKSRGRPPKALQASRTPLTKQLDDDLQNASGVGFAPRTRAQRAETIQRLRDFVGSSELADSALKQSAARPDEKGLATGPPPASPPHEQTSLTAEAEPTPEQQAREARRALRREKERAKKEKLLARRERDRIYREKSKARKQEQKRMEQEQRALELSTSIQAVSQEVICDEMMLKPTVPQLEPAVLHDSLPTLHVPIERPGQEHERLTQNAPRKQSGSKQDYQDHEGNYLGTESPALNSHLQQTSFNTMPQLVERVDDKQSFQMFNEGWVLPEGSSRRGNQGGSSSGQTGRSSGRNPGQGEGLGSSTVRERRGKRPSSAS
jgi:hypothetical protein